MVKQRKYKSWSPEPQAASLSSQVGYWRSNSSSLPWTFPLDITSYLCAQGHLEVLTHSLLHLPVQGSFSTCLSPGRSEAFAHTDWGRRRLKGHWAWCSTLQPAQQFRPKGRCLLCKAGTAEAFSHAIPHAAHVAEMVAGDRWVLPCVLLPQGLGWSVPWPRDHLCAWAETCCWNRVPFKRRLREAVHLLQNVRESRRHAKH